MALVAAAGDELGVGGRWNERNAEEKMRAIAAERPGEGQTNSFRAASAPQHQLVCLLMDTIGRTPKSSLKTQLPTRLSQSYPIVVGSYCILLFTLLKTSYFVRYNQSSERWLSIG